MKRTGSGGGTSKSRSTSTEPRKSRLTTRAKRRFVVCVDDGGYVDLEPLKLYETLTDTRARSDGLIRVVDNSGEDYLYPKEYFRAIRPPKEVFELALRKP